MAGCVLWLGRLKKRQYVVTIIRFYAVDTATAAAESILREAGFGADIARLTKPADSVSCRPPITVNTALQIWKELVCGMAASKRLRPSL